MHISPSDKMAGLDIRGTFGYSGAFGRIAYGFNRFGFYDWRCGIYQKKYYFGKPYLSKMKFYRPTNPRTLKQQNWRAVCAYAWVLWADTDSLTRSKWGKIGARRRISGANAFMSNWLKQPTYGFGKINFGYNAFGL
jgi:hypothetical protein